MRQTAFIFLSIFFSILFVACGKNLNTDLDEMQESATNEITESTAIKEVAPTNKPAPPPSPPTISQTKGKESDENAIPMMNVPTFGYYKLPQNSVPLFSKSCLIVDNPAECSTELLTEWLVEKLKYAESGLRNGEYSIQNIVFEIDKNGVVHDVKHIGSSGNTICWSCMDIAIKTIKQFPDWVPATQNGEPVNYSLKLPVRFEGI